MHHITIEPQTHYFNNSNSIVFCNSVHRMGISARNKKCYEAIIASANFLSGIKSNILLSRKQGAHFVKITESR